MKKHIFAVVIVAIITCLAVLSGCTMVRGFEKDLQVVLKVDGEYKGCYTVNQFNNAVVPVPEAPKGLVFYGWTADPDWASKDIAEVKVSQNKGLIRYDDVKDCVEGDKLSVTLYPVFAEIQRHDIAIAWYNKVATSGLDENVIKGFTDKLYAFLTSKGFDTSNMDIVIRPYAGNVGPTCDAIKNDGDIDIMIGWSHAENLTTTGGLKAGEDFVENNGNILINPDKARYAARLSDTENSKLVYEWIITEFAGEGGATPDYKWDGTTEPDEPDEPDVPDTPDEPGNQSGIKYTIGAEDVLTLKIGCYGFLKTSGFSNEIKANFEEGLKAALKECGATDEQLAGVEVKFYCYSESTGAADDTNNVSALDKAIEADGGVDILLGGRAFTDKNGAYCKPLIKESSDDMVIGTSDNRKVIIFNNKGLTRAVYNWVLSPEGLALLATPNAA